MNDLSKTRIIILLTDSSQKVTDTEMQDAYDEFIRCIATIGSSTLIPQHYYKIFFLST